MQRALDTILQETERSTAQQARAFHQTSEEIEIEATDLYVRFLPKDSLELDLLEKDTTLAWYDYPLDYEIEEQGDYYHDPDLEPNQITWQYTVVKPGHDFPEVEYEVLSELFIPENSEGYREEENPQGRRVYSKTYSLDKLETVSLYLTNNLPEQEKAQIEKEKETAARARRVCIWFICWDEPDPWNPSGRVLIEDSELGWQPIQGVQMRARRWFNTKIATTNSKGYFSTGSFRRPANYSLRWTTYQFSIREKALGFIAQQAWIDGPKQRSPWNVNLYKHAKHWFHGTIFQAAHHYYYESIKGLKRPPTNSFWKPQMKIRAHFKRTNDDDDNGTHCKDCRLFGVFARLRIYKPQRSSSAIYATTIHELAHASHWELRKNNWHPNYLPSKVKESWATGVQWELTRMKYTTYKGRPWGGSNDRNYTLVVADMIDGPATYSTRINYGFINPEDQVSGYTIKQIEDVLSYTSSWEGWKNNLKNRYNNPTKANLDTLFKSYE